MSTQPRAPRVKRVTVPGLKERVEAGHRLTMLTAYDSTFAHLFDEAGIDILLVGDSVGMVVQGHDDTLSVTLDDIVYHCRAVARSTSRAHIVADMPFLTYQVALDEAVRNAGRLMSVGRAHAVKLEGGAEIKSTVAAIVRAGIPVMGHVGLTPQRMHQMGGFRVQGREREQADEIVRDAIALQEAGVYAVVIEGVPTDVARRVTQALEVPTIGIGAGPSCDGQVLVGYDMLGLTPHFKPKFVKHFANFYEDGLKATRQYIADVEGAVFPAEEHTFSQKRALRAVEDPDAKQRTG